MTMGVLCRLSAKTRKWHYVTEVDQFFRLHFKNVRISRPAGLGTGERKGGKKYYEAWWVGHSVSTTTENSVSSAVKYD